MNYYKCKWLTATKEDPFRIIFEVGKDNFETRKIEFCFNGTYGYAYDRVEFNGTRLGIVPIPSLEEIKQNPEFQISEINKEEFEFIWGLLISGNVEK